MNRRSLTLVLGAVAAMVLFVVGASANLSGSSFEGNDGNLVVDTTGNEDWANAPNLSVGVDLPTGTTDNSFGGGSKEDETAVTVGLGSIPNSKADLARFAVAGEQNASGDSFVYLAWSRENQSGTVNFDFEINAAPQPDLTTAGGKTLNRTVNDLLINYAFAGGSNTPTLTLRKWTGSAWGSPADLTGCSEGQTNGAPVSENLGGNPAVIRPAQQFGEAAINMTCAGVIPKNACTSFADAYVKSRSSTSFTSEIKDFIAPVSVDLDFCGSITIIKHTNPRGLPQDFSYTASNGLASPFTLNDNGNTTGDSAGNTKKYSDVHEGTYVFTEGADPTGFKFNNVSCTGGGTNTTTSGRVATVGLDANEDVVCTYVNDQQLGAIKVSKKSIKSGSAALKGAEFTITGLGGTYSKVLTTGDDGTACVDGLTFGSYSVTETKAPAGYSIDDTSAHPLTINVNEKCDVAAVDFAATDTPLTNITASADSVDDGPGGTNTIITCKQGTTTVGGPTANEHNPSLTVNGLKPGTYTCTLVIDP